MAHNEEEVRAHLVAAHLDVARSVYEARRALILTLILFKRLVYCTNRRWAGERKCCWWWWMVVGGGASKVSGWVRQVRR